MRLLAPAVARPSPRPRLVDVSVSDDHEFTLMGDCHAKRNTLEQVGSVRVVGC
jgi:hypothetical protein